MSDNNYSWNQTLKFSWGHIIAFVALVFISYVTYMGDFYSNGGDFMSSAIKVCIIDVAIILTFIGAQIFKGTDEKFDRSIIIERTLICLCPLVFMLAMIPYNHFWSVFSSKEQIEPKFTSAIEKSRQMFSNYDNYSRERIATYSGTLSSIIANKATNRDAYLDAGFNDFNDEVVKDNYITTLRLQLLSQNTDSLRNSAMKWIDEANQGASVWNAFLVGNIEMISEAIEDWNQQLYEVSVPILSNENIDSSHKVVPFDPDKGSFKVANEDLAGLRNLFVNQGGISMYTIISSFFLFLMLIFPYFLQKRNTRATGIYSLIPHALSNGRIERKINEVTDFENRSSFSSDSSQSSDDIYGGTF